MSEDPNAITEEEKKQAEAVIGEINKYLGVMVNSIQEFDVKNFFVANAAICRAFTEEEIAKEGKIIPPWEIPAQTVQMHMLHFKIEMLLAILAKANVIDVAMRNHLREKDSQTLVKPVGSTEKKLIL